MSLDRLNGTGNRQTPRGLPRSVVLLSWISFFADVSGEMIYPLIPVFVVGVLGASATTLGGIEGSATLVVAFITAWAGWHSDRIRSRVPYIRLGYGLPVLGKSLLAVAFAWPLVLAGRLVDRLGKGMRTSPRDALIADATVVANRGQAFGFHRMLDTAGALLGVLLAAGILWLMRGDSAQQPSAAEFSSADGTTCRVVFAISAALGLASLFLAFLVEETPRVASETSPSPRPIAATQALPRRYWLTIAPFLVFGLANSSDTFLLLRAHDLGMPTWSVTLAYALFNLMYAAVSYPAGFLSDRLGRWRVIGLGWLVYAGVYWGFAFLSVSYTWLLLAAYGVFMALTEGIGKALVADNSPPNQRATAIGVFYMANGCATLVASLVAGWVWDAVGPAATFCLGGGLAILAVLLIPICHRSISRVTDASK